MICCLKNLVSKHFIHVKLHAACMLTIVQIWTIMMCSPPRYSTLSPLHCLQILKSLNPNTISHYTALQFSSQEVTGAFSPEFVIFSTSVSKWLDRPNILLQAINTEIRPPMPQVINAGPSVKNILQATNTIIRGPGYENT